MAVDEDGRLGLRVVVRIIAGEELQRTPVDGAEPGGRVGDPLPDHHRDHPGEDDDADAPQHGGPVAVARRRTGVPTTMSASTGDDRVEQLAYLARVVLPVAVDLDCDLEPLRGRTGGPSARLRRCRGCTAAGARSRPLPPATAAVSSGEPSSTTTTARSGSNACSSATTAPTEPRLVVRGDDDKHARLRDELFAALLPERGRRFSHRRA